MVDVRGASVLRCLPQLEWNLKPENKKKTREEVNGGVMSRGVLVCQLAKRMKK